MAVARDQSQLQIDAGQERGPTLCLTCGTVYSKGIRTFAPRPRCIAQLVFASVGICIRNCTVVKFSRRDMVADRKDSRDLKEKKKTFPPLRYQYAGNS